jgi:hypothetical protein
MLVCTRCSSKCRTLRSVGNFRKVPEFNTSQPLRGDNAVGISDIAERNVRDISLVTNGTSGTNVVIVTSIYPAIGSA